MNWGREMKKVSWVIVILLFAQACRSGFSDRIEQIPVSSEDTIFTTKTLEATEAKERYSELFYFKQKSRSDELASQIGSFQENRRENIFNIIDKALDELPFGNAVFTAKNHMLVGETQVAKLVLSVSEPLEKLREILGQRKDSERVFLEKSQIQVAPFMKATLIPSPGLLLRTIQENDGERVIDTKGIHEWSWDLK